MANIARDLMALRLHGFHMDEKLGRMKSEKLDKNDYLSVFGNK